MANRGEVQLTSISKRFGELVAVNSIDLHIPDGSYCCLLGPSGCGKTTILRMIAGHETPDRGTLTIGGENVIGIPPARRGTSLMFQSYALFPHLNVLDNVAFGLKMRGVGKEERRRQSREMLARVRLESLAVRMPSQLSGGQQQRVALARALITSPRVLLLDEPLSQLDESLRVQMRRELKTLQESFQITFVHVTHSQPEAIALADRIIVMNRGRIEQVGDARTIYNAPRNAYVAQFMGAENILTGTVQSVSVGSAAVSSTDGALFICRIGTTAPVQGQSVALAVRRDRLSVARLGAEPTHPPARANELAGKVIATEYQGTHVKLTLADLGPGEFIAYQRDDLYAADPVMVGEWVAVSWPDQEAHFLAE